MKPDPLKPILILAVLLLSACAPAPTSEALLPTELPVQRTSDGVDLRYHPLDTMTGIDEIDAVVQAVASADAQQLRDLFNYTLTTCMTVNALGGPPPCREGEAEGSPVEVLPILGPEGSYLRRDEAGNYPHLQVAGVYAIYETSDSAYSEENYPAGEYGIMLVGAGSDPGYVLQVKDGQIVRIDYIFGFSSIRDRLQRDASNFILAPISSAQ